MTSLAQKNRTVGIRAALFGLAMLGLQQDDPRWWRWMQVVGRGPEAPPDTLQTLDSE